jgi:hypothetical protein
VTVPKYSAADPRFEPIDIGGNVDDDERARVRAVRSRIAEEMTDRFDEFADRDRL